MITWRREYLKIGEGERRERSGKCQWRETGEFCRFVFVCSFFFFFFLRAFFFSAVALIKVSTPLSVWALEYLYPYLS